jgi:hypothetical protein
MKIGRILEMVIMLWIKRMGQRIRIVTLKVILPAIVTAAILALSLLA